MPLFFCPHRHILPHPREPANAQSHQPAPVRRPMSASPGQIAAHRTGGAHRTYGPHTSTIRPTHVARTADDNSTGRKNKSPHAAEDTRKPPAPRSAGRINRKSSVNMDTALDMSLLFEKHLNKRPWGRGSCSTPIRTGTERTKNSSAAITPWNIHNNRHARPFCAAKIQTFCYHAKPCRQKGFSRHGQSRKSKETEVTHRQG